MQSIYEYNYIKTITKSHFKTGKKTYFKYDIHLLDEVCAVCVKILKMVFSIKIII